MACKHCDDGDGNSIFPCYALTPHTHDPLHQSTKFDIPQSFDSNFRPDEESKDSEGIYHAGTYLRCPECGDGEDSMEGIA